MKATKKLMALVLVAAMVMAMAISASAATITIQDQQSEKFTEEVYQMCTYVDDGSGNKWYKVNDAWKPFLETIFNIDSNGYLQGYKTGKGDTSIAAELPAWLKATENYAAVAGTKVNDLTAVVPGYYVLITKDKTSGDIQANIGAAGVTDQDGTLTIRQKNLPEDLPKLEKTMSDTGKAYKVGDIREFTVKLIMEEGDTTYTITDTMTGLELANNDSDGDVDADDITVSEVEGAKIEKEITTANSAFKVTVTFNDGEAAEAYETVTITYKAKVTEAGVSGIGNTAQIEGEGKSDSTESKTTGFTVKKTDDAGNALSGAEFELYVGDDTNKTKVPLVYVEDAVNGNYYRPANDAEITAASAIVPISAGTAEVKGLEEGKTYYLKETKAPAGYIAVENYITAAGGEVAIKNTKSATLPETGGMGTTLFHVTGVVLVLAAVVLLVTKKRCASR